LTAGRNSYRFLFIPGLLLILIRCSVEKNTPSTRFFHGLTSKYNIYFNGNESFKAGLARINTGYTDDYSELLKIFEFSDPATVSMCSADMDRAIQKASKVISLKSITVKPEVKGNALPSEKEEEFLNRKEYNEWVDDSYLLMGKARLYRHEFELAKSTLNYNISNSSDIVIRNESTIWLARAYNETGNYNESYRILNELDPSVNFTKELKSLYYTTLADLYMKQKRYEEAITPLVTGLEYISGKRNKYRLTYLLAQLYEKVGDDNNATAYYRKVVKMNPPYEVEFNARINLAGVFDLNTGNPEAMKKELGKMLKDSKNKDYRDQIYYALGNLLKKEGEINEALSNYKKSAAASTINRNQKARSFLALAEYFYDKPDYMNSGIYYDSAIFFLDPKYPDFQQIKTKSQNLNSLVEQLTIIQREDSLQRVAAMDPSARNTLIASIIEQVRQDEEAKAAGSEYTDRYNLGQYYENERRFQGNIDQEGKWYFYNQAALTFGRTEFRRRWGDRKLEDNWRRMNKSRSSISQATAAQEENTQADTAKSSSLADNKKPEFYLRNLPMNDSLMAVSDERIANACLEAGKIYNEKFNDTEKSVESFESLLKRYPGNILEPEAIYSIYKVYKDTDNPRSETYRQRLVEKYPDNEYTKIITDPDYYNKKLEAQKEAESLYESAYDAYTKEDFTDAISICENALERFSKHELAPKFLLLKSLCVARISDERTFKDELKTLITLWPNTPESTKASELIAYLNKEVPELKVEEDKLIAEEIYTDDKETPQTFVAIIMNPAFNINQASFDIISYNIDNYTNKNYKTQGSLVDDKYILFTVSGFSALQEAMDYYSAFNAEQIIRNPAKSAMMTFIIGKNNLDILNKDKNPERYRLFFNEKYLAGDNNK
jgi:tetratricopeptide (TPR) repeat protein